MARKRDIGTAKTTWPRVYAKTKKELASIFGAQSLATIGNWLAAGAPAKTQHGYDVGAWVKWWAEDHGLISSAVESREPSDLRGKAKKEYYAGEIEKLKYQQLTGELISREDHERSLNKRSGWIASVLEMLPGRLAGLVAGKSAVESKRVIDEQCKELRAMAYGEVA